MNLSIIIASYNTRDTTRRCLQSIFNQTSGVEFEVIVVDNHSTDASSEMIGTEFPEVILIRNSKNLGFAAAQNIGLQIAQGDFLLVLNSDMLFVGNPCKTLIDFLRVADSKVGVVGPQILNPDGTVAPSARRTRTSWPMLMLSIINRHFKLKRFLPPEAVLRKYLGFILSAIHDNYAPHDRTVDAEYVDGMCIMIKREVLYESGPFDEQFFFDFEILDLCNRIRACGWRIQFFPGAQVIHLGHASRKQVSRILIETHRSELVYYTKYQPQDISFLRFVALVIIAIKMLCLRVAIWFGGDTYERSEALRIYEQIWQDCLNFDPALVAKSERIPRLSSHPST